MRLTKISRTMALAATLACVAAPASFADEPSVAEQTVATMYKLWGEHPGTRANHAKGLVVEGSFAPSPAGAKLSKAALFQGKPIPLTVRFSNSTGLPTIPDGDPNANPHGMAMKFHLAGGGDVDVVTNSLKFFPVATGEEFRDLLVAVSQTSKDSPHPSPIEKFMAAHPVAPKAFGSVSTPVSWGREVYNGVDAFVFVDAKGTRQPFRFQIVPVQGPQHLTAAQAAKMKPDFLTDEMTARLAKAPVRFRLLAQLANPGDQTKDPSQPWPADRKMVELGVITLTKVTPDNAAASKTLLFLPNNLTDGIEVSDDPLIDARDQAYGVSYGHRSQ